MTIKPRPNLNRNTVNITPVLHVRVGQTVLRPRLLPARALPAGRISPQRCALLALHAGNWSGSFAVHCAPRGSN